MTMDVLVKGLNYSYIEVQRLLSSLSEADITRLLQSYRIMGCDRRAAMTDKDVLGVVVKKVLTMERAWPRNESVLPYLIETGRSEISNEAKKIQRRVTTDPAEIERMLDAQIAGPECHIEHHQFEDEIVRWIDKVRMIFANDQEASCFIDRKLEGEKKAVIMRLCDLSDRVYRNVEKRIKDKVRKKFPKGLPWQEAE